MLVLVKRRRRNRGRFDKVGGYGTVCMLVDVYGERGKGAKYGRDL